MKNSKTYRHTQPGWTILIFLLSAMILNTGFFLPSGSLELFYIITMFLILLGVLFGSLTIKVNKQCIEWNFGVGFWKKKIELEEIDVVDVVINKWYYGWGIRYTPHGWLYNVSGFSAIELKLKNGKNIRLGSDQPELLKNAILQNKDNHSF